MSGRVTLNLTVGKQQSVLVYIILHVSSPKDSSRQQRILCLSWVGLRLHVFTGKTADLVKASRPSFSFGEVFFFSLLPQLNLQSDTFT